MTASSHLPAPNLMPLMRYRDLAEAMGWLERAFGFEKQIAVSDSDGAVIYGQMTYRGSLMMMGAVRDTDLDKLMRQPDEVGGVETQSCYLVIDDADAHYARAQEAGAEIVLELKSDGLGRRGYSCRDPEGHIWNFGTYNPAKGLTMTVASPAPDPAEAPRRRPRALMGVAALLLALGAAWWLAPDIGAAVAYRFGSAEEQQAAREAEKAYAELVKERAEKRQAEQAAEAASKALEAERARRLDLESSAGNAREKLAQEESARRAAEAAVATLQAELKRKQEALDAAVEAKRVSEEKLAVKSASVEAAPTAAEPARSMAPPAPGTNGIETSATRPVSEAQSGPSDEAVDADDEDDQSRSAARRGRQSRPSLRRSKIVFMQASKPRYPLYVIDLRHTWPYSAWTR